MGESTGTSPGTGALPEDKPVPKPSTTSLSPSPIPTVEGRPVVDNQITVSGGILPSDKPAPIKENVIKAPDLPNMSLPTIDMSLPKDIIGAPIIPGEPYAIGAIPLRQNRSSKGTSAVGSPGYVVSFSAPLTATQAKVYQSLGSNNVKEGMESIAIYTNQTDLSQVFPNLLQEQKQNIIEESLKQIRPSQRPGANVPDAYADLVDLGYTILQPQDMPIDRSLANVGQQLKAYGGLINNNIRNELGTSGVRLDEQTKTISFPLYERNVLTAEINKQRSDVIGPQMGASFAGPTTAKSEGKNVGQASLGYVQDVYSPAQVESLIKAKNEDIQYGGLASMQPAPKKETPAPTLTDTSKSIEQKQSDLLGAGLMSLSKEQQTAKQASEALGAGLISLSNQQIGTRNQLAEQQNINAKVNNAIDKLTFESSIKSEAVSAGAKSIDVLQITKSTTPYSPSPFAPIPGQGLEVTKTQKLESIPIEKADTLLPGIIQKYSNKPNVVLSYTPTPVVNKIGAGLEFEMPSLFENIYGRPVSAFADIISNAVLGTGSAIYSLPFQIAKEVQPFVKGQLPGLISGPTPLPPEAEAFNKEYLYQDYVSTGLSGLIAGKGLSGFTTGTGKGLEYDIPSLIGSAALLVVGAKGALPFRYTEAVLEKSQGLTRDIPIYKAVTFGYSPGGSKYVIVGKSPEGPITFGTPKPESYLPKYALPIKESGRGFTGSEGGGLLNELLNRNAVLEYYQKENILTPHDVELFKAVREASPIVVKSPVQIFHPELGPQPLETVLQGKETEALKDIIKTGQKSKDLGPQYGSFGDIPFVPGKVKVGDLDLAVNSATHQEQIGLLAEKKLSEAAEFGRTFKFEKGGVNVYTSGETGTTKIIDLPIKGKNEEGGVLSENTYNKVFGVKEPTETFMIEGIEVKTPHYNTLRRSTTLTRIGSTHLESNIPGFGYTTKYGNYIGPEYGRLKDVARTYRGYILAAKSFRERGRLGDVAKAEKLEKSALTIKNRFQHVYNFSQALKEIEGEGLIIEKEEIPKISTSSQSSILKSNIEKTPVILSSEAKFETEKPIASEARSSSIKSNEDILMSRGMKSALREPRSRSKSISKIERSASKSALRSEFPSLKPKEFESISSLEKTSLYPTPKSEASIFKSESPESILSSIESSLQPLAIKSKTSSLIPSRSNEPSILSSSPTSLYPTPRSVSPSPIYSGINRIVSGPQTMFEIPFKTDLTDIIPLNKEDSKRKLLDLNLATKTTEGIKPKPADRYNFLGNTSELDVKGIYNREETTYGKQKISKLRSEDISKFTKGQSRFITSKSTGSFVNKSKREVILKSPKNGKIRI